MRMAEPHEHRPDDLEPEPEMFDASNIEHAKKLAAALWAVDIVVSVTDAAPAMRVVLKATDGRGLSADVVATGVKGVSISESGKLSTTDGRELVIDSASVPEEVPMLHLSWVAKFGEHRFGDAILIPAERRTDGLRALSVNMVRTMLALVVNGTIGRADVDHGKVN